MSNRFNWLRRLESRDYLLHGRWLAIAALIGVVRYAEEVLFIYLPQGESITFNDAADSVTFYTQIIWLYVAAIVVLARLPWRRTLGPAIAGTLLALAPPLIDVLTYGTTGFNYFYQFDFYQFNQPHEILNLVLFPIDPAGLPLGEVLVLHAGACLLTLYVGVRSRSLWRAGLALVAGYGLVHIYGSGLAILGTLLDRFVHSLLVTISLLQVLLVLVIYYGLNPRLLRQAFYRLPHALPAPLLVLLGGTIARRPIGPTAAISLIAGIVTMIAVHQNDFYDHVEDAVDGRNSVVTREDVHFFYAVLVLLLVVTAMYRVVVMGLVAAFYFLTLLYHHRRFRLKRIFPLSYLIEGVCAAAMVSAGILSTAGRPERWTVWLGAVAGFLAFALGSAFKDYKDIEGDRAAGNATVYTLAQTPRTRARTGVRRVQTRGQTRRWPLQRVHRVVTLILTVQMAAPAIWLRWRGAPLVLCIILGVCACVLIPSALLAIRDRKRATVTTLWLVNVYLLAYALAARI